MSFTGTCPECKTKLPLRVKDRVACSSCGAIIEADEKSAMAWQFTILVVGFVGYMIEWRLLLVTIPVCIYFGIKKTGYNIVSKKNNENS
tara:strand:- start:2607 stop:2873 length:267 start_codon:yes stop_codon:yes gene_type:complete